MIIMKEMDIEKQEIPQHIEGREEKEEGYELWT